MNESRASAPRSPSGVESAPAAARPGDAPIATTSLDLARAAYRDLPVYSPDLRPCAISLNDNTNRFGVPPAALRALREPALDDVVRYPAPFADHLKGALARYAGVRPEEIATGCGSDDVIDSAIRAFTEPGDRIAFADPTFAMLPLFARMNGLVPVAVPLAGYDIDPDALLAADARVIYLCSPDNPTGAAHPRAAIERVLRESSGIVILDEAYAEYAGDGWLGEAPAHGRLLVTRTLSKAFGLAGLRIGYAAGDPGLIAEVEKSRGPFKVGAIAERAAVAALTEDLGWVRARVEELLEARTRFVASLSALGLSPLPTAANFVLLPVRDAAAVAAGMRRGGVAIRPFRSLLGVGDAVRITIGPWPMMEAALSALKEALAATEDAAR